MFGMEKGKDESEFFFDLEKEIEDVSRYQEIVETIEQRTAFIKDLLRKGEKKQSYNELAIILHGYASALKVMSRCVSKKSKN